MFASQLRTILNTPAAVVELDSALGSQSNYEDDQSSYSKYRDGCNNMVAGESKDENDEIQEDESAIYSESQANSSHMYEQERQ